MSQSIEFGRRPGETDEEWAATCKEMAACLATAWGMEHLLPAQAIEAQRVETENTGSVADESAVRQDAPKGANP